MRSICQGKIVCAIGVLAMVAGVAVAEVPTSRLPLDQIEQMISEEGPWNWAEPGGETSQTTRAEPYVISLSGATLMRNYTTSSGSTNDMGVDVDGDGVIELGTGSSPPCVTDDGDIDGDVVFGWEAPLAGCRDGVTLDQLAPGGNGDAGHWWTTYWREQGSLGGIEDLVDSQLNGLTQTGPNPNNPLWVNRNKFLGSDVIGGFIAVCELYGDTNGNGQWDSGEPVTDITTPAVPDPEDPENDYVYQADVWDCPYPQPPVMMAISDVKSAQAFAVGDEGNAAWNKRPKTEGYGLNPAISPRTGTKAQQLRNETTLGPDGTDALADYNIAIGAAAILANPGTGLTEVTDVECQWVLVHSRFPNGVDVNLVTRDTNSGTRNTVATNLHTDVSWAMGENDGGGDAPLANLLGTQIRYSEKTSSSHMKPTVRNSRFSMGYNSVSGTFSENQAGAITMLAVDFTEATGETGDTLGPQLPNLEDIMNGNWRIWTRQQYIRVKDTDFVGDPSTYDMDACASPGPYTGDPDCAVHHYVRNMENSFQFWPNDTTTGTPADALLLKYFIFRDCMEVIRTDPGGTPGNDNGVDGDPYLTNPSYDSGLQQDVEDFYAGTWVIKDPATCYGLYEFDPVSTGSPDKGDVIEQDDRIMGDFNKNGYRDLDDAYDTGTPSNPSFANALGDVSRPACTPCECTDAGSPCVPPDWEYNGQHPGVMADFTDDACVNEDDAYWFCTTLPDKNDPVNGDGNWQKNACIDRMIAGGVSISQHEDIDRDGVVDCVDVLIVYDLLQQAGPDGILYLADFDDAFIIGDDIGAEQDDNGQIDATDMAIVMAAAGVSSIEECLPGCTCGDIDRSGGQVNLGDFATFAVCYGLSAANPPGCDAAAYACSDMDGSGIVDLNDFASFAAFYGLDTTYTVPNCVLP